MSLSNFLLFLAAATVIALTPGPGIFYVAARTLANGKQDGLAASWGTGVGGIVHVGAGALGVSALVMASAEAFTVLKFAGALYLLWLGVTTIRAAGAPLPAEAPTGRPRSAFRDGVMVEALNPKTAIFFLAFIPQFLDPTAHIASQFAVLGAISVAMNTAVDVAVAHMAGRVRIGMMRRPRVMRRLRRGSGAVMCGLGASLLFASHGK